MPLEKHHPKSKRSSKLTLEFARCVYLDRDEFVSEKNNKRKKNMPAFSRLSLSAEKEKANAEREREQEP